MTTLLYLEDPYLHEFEASVTSIDPTTHAILLDRSAFYPGGGGQPADHGWLNYAGASYPVIRLRKAPEGLWHHLPPEAPLPTPGTMIQGKLDWERRYALMRTHRRFTSCAVWFFAITGPWSPGAIWSLYRGVWILNSNP